MEVLEDIVREGARRMLQAALEAEIDTYISHDTRTGRMEQVSAWW